MISLTVAAAACSPLRGIYVFRYAIILPLRKTLRRGRCPHRPAPNKTGNIYPKPKPPIVGANTVRPLIPLHFRQRRPRENTVKPSGGIARCPRCPPGLANADGCPFRYLPRSLSACCLCRRSMLFFGVCRAIIPFFFSLLKRKKEAKKEKFSPTLVCAAMHHTKGNTIFVTRNINPPEGL